MDLALNNLQRLICHKTKQANKQTMYLCIYAWVYVWNGFIYLQVPKIACTVGISLWGCPRRRVINSTLIHFKWSNWCFMDEGVRLSGGDLIDSSTTRHTNVLRKYERNVVRILPPTFVSSSSKDLSYGSQTWPIKWNTVSSKQRSCRYCDMDALHGR